MNRSIATATLVVLIISSGCVAFPGETDEVSNSYKESYNETFPDFSEREVSKELPTAYNQSVFDRHNNSVRDAESLSLVRIRVIGSEDDQLATRETIEINKRQSSGLYTQKLRGLEIARFTQSETTYKRQSLENPPRVAGRNLTSVQNRYTVESSPYDTLSPVTEKTVLEGNTYPPVYTTSDSQRTGLLGDVPVREFRFTEERTVNGSTQVAESRLFVGSQFIHGYATRLSGRSQSSNGTVYSIVYLSEVNGTTVERPQWVSEATNQTG